MEEEEQASLLSPPSLSFLRPYYTVVEREREWKGARSWSHEGEEEEAEEETNHRRQRQRWRGRGHRRRQWRRRKRRRRHEAPDINLLLGRIRVEERKGAEERRKRGNWKTNMISHYFAVGNGGEGGEEKKKKTEVPAITFFPVFAKEQINVHFVPYVSGQNQIGLQPCKGAMRGEFSVRGKRDWVEQPASTCA